MKILLTEPIPGKALEMLSSQHEIVVGDRGEFDDETRLYEAIEPFDALLCCLSNPVTGRVIQKGKKLKIISTYAAGYNNIDIATAKKRGIPVAHTPGVLTNATADCAFSLLLSLIRNLREAEDALRRGKFDGWHPFLFRGMELHGKKAGIYGMGRIGLAFARRAAGFGMSILYHNRKRLDPETERALQAKYVPTLNELVSESDVLSIHVPLTSETHHAINAGRIAMMKSHSVIINTARGPVIDEKALAVALHEKRIGGAGLDVFEFEPEIEQKLLTAPNCVLLPHIGSATVETRDKMSELAASAILICLEGKPPESIPNLLQL